jgi:lipid II:glycine glycyltransferase (peptidoglycan interpeptide bridge formation enzyme)
MQLSFLQSKEWEKFQQSVGYKTFRVDDVLLIKKPLGFGRSYFYAPRTGMGDRGRGTEDFFSKVKELAKKENCIFIRTEPLAPLLVTRYPLHKVTDIQPSQTIILDLTQSEDELLAQMHPKTRYNIRLAEKHGVKVREEYMNEPASSADKFEKFWNLMQETVGRDGFRSHDKEYYRKMLARNNNGIASPEARNDMNIRLYVAEYEGKTLASGIFVFFNETVTYLHGASTHERKEVMAPQLLHWEIIKLAKNAGYRYYDLYGISETKWPGVTRFKRGFGGKEINYPGCFDVVFSKGWYKFYNLARRIRKLI